MATMAEAVQAALVGPARKKLRIYDHEFNVKPAEPAKQNNRLVVNGHISHHLGWGRPDDQVYYLITIEDATIKDIQRDIARGGWAGLAGPVVSVVGAYFGVPIPPDKVESLGRALGQAFDGTWEKAAEIIIANIAMAFQQKELESKPGGTGPQGTVQGAIRDKWIGLGSEQGFLGYPLTDETPTPDGHGRYNHFQGGSIYWTPETGAHEVHGAIREKWAALGWERSVLGYPITDEETAGDRPGRVSTFQGGWIYWDESRGAYEVYR